MYIYLDESYNLKDRKKKQFISINGFTVLNERSLFKKWKECRYPFIGKRRIHAVDSYFNKLRLKTLKLIGRPDLTLLSVFQVLQELPFEKERAYFRKNKLDLRSSPQQLIFYLSLLILSLIFFIALILKTMKSFLKI